MTDSYEEFVWSLIKYIPDVMSLMTEEDKKFLIRFKSGHLNMGWISV
jgi:hypothetical protein